MASPDETKIGSGLSRHGHRLRTRLLSSVCQLRLKGPELWPQAIPSLGQLGSLSPGISSNRRSDWCASCKTLLLLSWCENSTCITELNFNVFYKPTNALPSSLSKLLLLCFPEKYLTFWTFHATFIFLRFFEILLTSRVLTRFSCVWDVNIIAAIDVSNATKKQKTPNLFSSDLKLAVEQLYIVPPLPQCMSTS